MKTAKVIALWGGRRSWQPKDYNAKHNVEMLKILVEHEKSINNGAEMDLILVNSEVENPKPEYEDYLNYLSEIDGASTKNGNIIVLHKNNIGLSHGAFDYAFQKYIDQYDYWYFSEDDYVNIAEGIVPMAIEELQSSNIGFVSTLMIRKSNVKEKGWRVAGGTGLIPVFGVENCDGWFALGGTGITSTEILKQILGLRKNDDSQGNSHLPFCRLDGRELRRGSSGCPFVVAEKYFTMAINTDLNYDIDTLKYKDIRLRRGTKRPAQSQYTTGSCLRYYAFILLFHPHLVKPIFGL